MGEGGSLRPRAVALAAPPQNIRGRPIRRPTATAPVPPMLRTPLRLAAASLLLLAALPLAACSGGPTKASAPSSVDASGGPGRWLEPSPQLARRIEVRANEAEFIASLDQFQELTEWFYGVGEPAYPTLLDMSASGTTWIRRVGMAVIAMRGDPRLLEPFKEHVPMPPRSEPEARYDWARAVLAMNDLAGVPLLIEGLEAETEITRRQARRELTRHLGETGVEFDPAADPAVRAAQVREWREWYDRMVSQRSQGTDR